MRPRICIERSASLSRPRGAHLELARRRRAEPLSSAFSRLREQRLELAEHRGRCARRGPRPRASRCRRTRTSCRSRGSPSAVPARCARPPRGPGHAHHALAELEGRRLDLLGEQDLLLLGEGRDVGDVAEVRHQRAALAGALALAFGVQPLAPYAHPIDRARIEHRLRVGLGAELGVRSAPSRPLPGPRRPCSPCSPSLRRPLRTPCRGRVRRGCNSPARPLPRSGGFQARARGFRSRKRPLGAAWLGSARPVPESRLPSVGRGLATCGPVTTRRGTLGET